MRRSRQPPKTLRSDARQAAEACAGWNSRAAARRITRFLDRQLAKTGLGVAQFGLMATIAAASDDRLAAIADRTGLDQSTLSRNLRTLEAEGLVEIATVEGDLRRRAVWLTESGARRLESAMPVWRAAQAALARLVDPAMVRRVAFATEALDRD